MIRSFWESGNNEFPDLQLVYILVQRGNSLYCLGFWKKGRAGFHLHAVLYRQESQIVPLQWVQLQPGAGVTVQWVRLVPGGWAAEDVSPNFRGQIHTSVQAFFFILLKCFWRSFALQKKNTLAIWFWSEISHLITEHVWEALRGWTGDDTVFST